MKHIQRKAVKKACTAAGWEPLSGQIKTSKSSTSGILFLKLTVPPEDTNIDFTCDNVQMVALGPFHFMYIAIKH